MKAHGQPLALRGIAQFFPALTRTAVLLLGNGLLKNFTLND